MKYKQWIVVYSGLTVLCLLHLGCARVERSSGLTEADRARITKEVTALDDARNKAADEGDANAALAFISRRPSFRYEVRDRVIRGFAEFEKVVREGYGRRKSMTTTVLDREIRVLSLDRAECVNQVKHEIVWGDGSTIDVVMNYESVWEREDEGWHVVEAVESPE